MRIPTLRYRTLLRVPETFPRELLMPSALEKRLFGSGNTSRDREKWGYRVTGTGLDLPFNEPIRRHLNTGLMIQFAANSLSMTLARGKNGHVLLLVFDVTRTVTSMLLLMIITGLMLFATAQVLSLSPMDGLIFFVMLMFFDTLMILTGAVMTLLALRERIRRMVGILIPSSVNETGKTRFTTREWVPMEPVKPGDRVRRGFAGETVIVEGFGPLNTLVVKVKGKPESWPVLDCYKPM